MKTLKTVFSPEALAAREKLRAHVVPGALRVQGHGFGALLLCTDKVGFFPIPSILGLQQNALRSRESIDTTT